MIRNPILRGFHPDPSIIRVGADYYIATSSFEWFPGVPIYHSRDLVNWELRTHALDRVEPIDLRGTPDSHGVWAPCLSHHDGTFYLIYSHVRHCALPWVDVSNYLITAQSIEGPWSEPVYLNSAGFDPSLFHDSDGRKWLLSMVADPREKRFFGGIILQEYDTAALKLTGPVHPIFDGTELGCTEGPHLYQRNGYYYLLTAEGGTSYEHAVSIARATSITGPYEVHPDNPILCTQNAPEHPLQKTGHGDFFDDGKGNDYIAFLTSRPIGEKRRCILGRETAIEAIEWGADGWPRLKHGGKLPRIEIPLPAGAESANASVAFHDDFDGTVLHPHFQTLRIPASEDWCSLTAHTGHLRLRGQDSLGSTFAQSHVAHRVQHFNSTAETCLEFAPTHFLQTAGLVCYYNTKHHYFLHLRGDPDSESPILIVGCMDKGNYSEATAERIAVTTASRLYLKAKIRQTALQFYCATQVGDWISIGPVLDASILSDDYVSWDNGKYQMCFTGAFYGLCCQDSLSQILTADFDYFTYTGSDE